MYIDLYLHMYIHVCIYTHMIWCIDPNDSKPKTPTLHAPKSESQTFFVGSSRPLIGAMVKAISLACLGVLFGAVGHRCLRVEDFRVEDF